MASSSIVNINKDPSNTYTGQVDVVGFSPASSGTVYSYGIPQDDAAETNGGAASQDIAATSFSGTGTNFDYAFPPYSATVLVLPPAAATLPAVPTAPAANQFVFQLQGQADVPYILQSSTNLLTWTSISTNTLSTDAINIANSVDPSTSVQFWRAIWQP